MERITTRQVEGVFRRWCSAMERQGVNPSAYVLSFYAGAGGYRIETTDGTTPLGERRRSRRDMWNFLYDTCAMLDHIERERSLITGPADFNCGGIANDEVSQRASIGWPRPVKPGSYS